MMGQTEMVAEPAQDPNSVEALFTRASQLHAAQRLEEAKTVLHQLLAAESTHAPGLNLLGICFGQQGDLAQGCTYVERAIAAAGPQTIYLRNLCELRRQYDDPFGAIEAGRQAVAASPDDLIARMNLAMAEQDALALDAAIANAEFTLAREPDHGSAHFLKAQVALMRGDLKLGWAEYAWRWKIPGAERPRPPNPTPDWDGTPITGRLLLIADQGFGDIMQFARFLPWAAQRCGALVIGVPRDLRRLIARLVPEAEVISDISVIAPADACEVFSSLPGLAGAELPNLPDPGGYLSPDPALLARWQKRLDQLAPGPNRRIALAWAGRREHKADRMRSMRLADLQPLLDLPGITFISLQKSDPVAQIGQYFGPAPLVNLGPELEDFDDTAAVLPLVGGLISVDTSVVHLAGALGVPTHVMLPFRPDWRWLMERTDTPWYDSVTLWRDTEPRGRAATVVRLRDSFAQG